MNQAPRKRKIRTAQRINQTAPSDHGPQPISGSPALVFRAHSYSLRVNIISFTHLKGGSSGIKFDERPFKNFR